MPRVRWAARKMSMGMTWEKAVTADVDVVDVDELRPGDMTAWQKGENAGLEFNARLELLNSS